jgi:hypothetical protein
MVVPYRYLTGKRSVPVRLRTATEGVEQTCSPVIFPEPWSSPVAPNTTYDSTVTPEDRERIEEWVARQSAADPPPSPAMVEAVYRTLRPSACDPRHWIHPRRTRSRT